MRGVWAAALATLIACGGGGDTRGEPGQVAPVATAGAPAPLPQAGAPTVPAPTAGAATVDGEPPPVAGSDAPVGTAGAPTLPPSMQPEPLAGAAPPPVLGAGPPVANLPVPTQPCPAMAEGDVPFLGRDVRLWMAPDAASKGQGPVIFYWHGTFSNPNFEAPAGLGQAIQAVKEQGGVVVGFYSLDCPGCRSTGNLVWFYEDFDLADEVLGCAIEQVGIDTRRIHAAGMSAGGLQATAMLYARSNYMASVTSYSGGVIPFVTDTLPQDPNNHVAAMIVHGGVDDIVGVRFQDTSTAFYDDLIGKGHFAFLCDHGMGHTIPSGISEATWQFFQDHVYGVEPSPYVGGLPAVMPSYCVL